MIYLTLTYLFFIHSLHFTSSTCPSDIYNSVDGSSVWQYGMTYFKKPNDNSRYWSTANNECTNLGMHLPEVVTVGDKLVFHHLWDTGATTFMNFW